jgi:putative CocE/NonD family hydrolase
MFGCAAISIDSMSASSGKAGAGMPADPPRRLRTEFPHEVRVIMHEWIPMSDGCRLAARIWLPQGAEQDPVPAVLEYVPYRKNDDLRLRDAPIHGYFAGCGYASLRVDIRGSGDSEGILEDEYLPLEQSDGLAALRWIASQPWCSGKVGIIGKSWGGFNGLQIAAHAPDELGAVISVASTDDRYGDDVHYMGGCVLSWTALNWASSMLAYDARPPDPAVVGDAWREIWLDRMDRSPPFVETWMSHQRRDEFWRQGSVCEDYAAIRCPVYMVGGWADAYRNAILRFVEDYPGPCKGLIGPWAHVYPHDGAPGPAIGFLQEAVRFWDRWLKGDANGIMAEPKLRVWMPDAFRPAPSHGVESGRWLAIDAWPAPQVQTRPCLLGAGTLGDTPGNPTELRIRGAESVATDPGDWGGHGGPTDFPRDQRPDDGLSLSFDTAPLSERTEILGFPIARLELASDRPLALVVARLCDIWPDGASTLITRGLMNLTHHRSHEHPEPLTPGRRYVIDVQLNSIAYSLPEGHRLRLSVSPTYWPWAWPSPEPVTLSLFTGDSSQLFVPTWPAGAGGHVPPAHFVAPEQAAMPAHEPVGPAGLTRREMRRDVASGAVEIVNEADTATIRFLDSGLEFAGRERDLYRIVEGEPLSAFAASDREMEIGRGEWHTLVRTSSTMSSTADEFQITNVLEAFEGDCRVFAKTWHFAVPRDHV